MTYVDAVLYIQNSISYHIYIISYIIHVATSRRYHIHIHIGELQCSNPPIAVVVLVHPDYSFLSKQQMQLETSSLPQAIKMRYLTVQRREFAQQGWLGLFLLYVVAAPFFDYIIYICIQCALKTLLEGYRIDFACSPIKIMSYVYVCWHICRDEKMAEMNNKKE